MCVCRHPVGDVWHTLWTHITPYIFCPWKGKKRGLAFTLKLLCHLLKTLHNEITINYKAETSNSFFVSNKNDLEDIIWSTKVIFFQKADSTLTHRQSLPWWRERDVCWTSCDFSFVIKLQTLLYTMHTVWLQYSILLQNINVMIRKNFWGFMFFICINQHIFHTLTTD